MVAAKCAKPKRRDTIRLMLAACLTTLVSGCDALEPFERPHTWHPTGANQANLAAMVADPIDLTRGQGTGGSVGIKAAAAIDRLRRDRVKQLPEGSSLSSTAAGASATPTAN